MYCSPTVLYNVVQRTFVLSYFRSTEVFYLFSYVIILLYQESYVIYTSLPRIVCHNTSLPRICQYSSLPRIVPSYVIYFSTKYNTMYCTVQRCTKVQRTFESTFVLPKYGGILSIFVLYVILCRSFTTLEYVLIYD